MKNKCGIFFVDIVELIVEIKHLRCVVDEEGLESLKVGDSLNFS